MDTDQALEALAGLLVDVLLRQPAIQQVAERRVRPGRFAGIGLGQPLGAELLRLLPRSARFRSAPCAVRSLDRCRPIRTLRNQRGVCGWFRGATRLAPSRHPAAEPCTGTNLRASAPVRDLERAITSGNPGGAEGTRTLTPLPVWDLPWDGRHRARRHRRRRRACGSGGIAPARGPPPPPRVAAGAARSGREAVWQIPPLPVAWSGAERWDRPPAARSVWRLASCCAAAARG